MKKSMIVLAALVSFSSFAQAASEDKCNLPSTMEIKGCLMEEYQKADADLNAAYKKAMITAKALDAAYEQDGIGGQNGEIQKRLQQAQRAWIPFRDATCELEGSEMLGGSGEGLIVAGCLNRVTQERTKELNKFTKNNSQR